MIKLNEIKMLELINNNDLEGLKLLIDTEIYNTDLTTTDKKQHNAFKKFAKSLSMKKSPVINKPSMSSAFIDTDNYITCCDSYRIIRLFTDKIVGCNMVDMETIEKDNVTMFDSAEMMNTTKMSNDVMIQLDIKDIMLNHKKFKASKEKKGTVKNHGVYVVELSTQGLKLNRDTMLLSNGKLPVAFNIDYLKEAIDMLGCTDDIQFTLSSTGTNLSPLFIDTNSGQGLLLPIRMLYKKDAETGKVVNNWYADYEKLKQI